MITFAQVFQISNFIRSCVNYSAISCFLGLGILSTGLVMGQDETMPRTQYGHPDFQGTYTFRTITPLNRPRELASKEVLTAEEAAEWEAFETGVKIATLLLIVSVEPAIRRALFLTMSFGMSVEVKPLPIEGRL